jgi:membrane associated rhomboid family serine protease
VYFLFFFPVGTESRPDHRPVGTALLLGVLLAAFALRFARPELYQALVLASFRPSDPQLGPAFLSLFLHAGWAHLLGNSLYLWIFGRQIEGRLGFLPLAAIFVVGGLLSCWGQSWLTPVGSPGRDLPLIGASGGVASLLGATVVRFPHRRVRVLWALFAFLGGIAKGGVVHLNAILACGSWFAFQIVQGLAAREAGGGGVAHAAHASGFLAGIAGAVLLGLHRGPRREIHRDRGRRHFEKSDWYAALGELTTHLDIVPDDLEARRMRARCLVLLGEGGEAAAEYLRLFRAARRSRDLITCASLYREMRVYGIGSMLDERALLRLAFDFQKAGRPGDAAEVYGEILTRFPEGEVTDLAAIRRAEILWGELGRYDEARACYRGLLERGRASEWAGLAEARLRSMEALAGAAPLRSRSPGTSTARPRPSSRPAS